VIPKPSQPNQRKPFCGQRSHLSKGLLLGAVAAQALLLAAPSPSAAIPLPKPRPAVHGSPQAQAPKHILPSTAAKPAQPPKQQVARKPSAPMAVAATSSTSQADRDALERVIELLRNRNVSDATQVRDTIADPVAQKLAEWLILRSEDNGLPAERYRAFISTNPSWPSLNLFRRRGEAALWDDRREDPAVVSWFANDAPLSAKGKLCLARALLAQGDRRNAEKYLREAWRSDPMSRDTEAAALDQFGALLTPGDHKARLDFLLFTDDTAGAMRAAERLGPAYLTIVKARMAVNRKEEAKAKALLDSVPVEVRGDPAYMFGRIQNLRRADKIPEAAELMLKAPRDPARLGNVDEWWIERRLIARKLLDTGDFRTAYAIARDAALPNKDIYQTEQQFTAGWIALRFLRDPTTALQHFARIGVESVNPTAIARAGYWQGRALEELGRTQEARAAYQSAAEQSTSYYGQLSRARLGLPQIALKEAPDRSRGSQYEVVRAVELLYALDERALAVPMLADMGERADDPNALAALAEVAGRNGDAKGMMLVGKAALNRGYPFDFYAYPVSGIPSFQQIGPEVEKSVVYAIARQESQFDQSVVSPAKAMGILQVTPEAGKYVTRKYGATYDQRRLLTDASYNATLGAAELGGLLQDYRGSYIMTFAGYNAGRGRVKEWIERYGDPRDPSIDPIDWVERIPFSETRNYVQRVIENLQVYRSRFGGGSRLLIEADLRRGGGAGEN
jgi:soluble lytic murein transglycosylase